MYSENFHSPKNPSVPILKDSIGGTLTSVLNKDDACRMVPSPPSVVAMSTFAGRVPYEVVVYIGKVNCLCNCAATFGSNMSDTLS